jgi:hypothetical protein
MSSAYDKLEYAEDDLDQEDSVEFLKPDSDVPLPVINTAKPVGKSHVADANPSQLIFAVLKSNEKSKAPTGRLPSGGDTASYKRVTLSPASASTSTGALDQRRFDLEAMKASNKPVIPERGTVSLREACTQSEYCAISIVFSSDPAPADKSSPCFCSRTGF